MRPKISFLLIVAIGVLAACNGNQRFAPVAPVPQSVGAQSLPFVPSGLASRSTASCNAPQYKPPGPFIVFVANGKIKKNTFKSASSPTTIWVSIKVKKAHKPTPPPTTSPSAAPSPTEPPADQPTYLYFGSYALAKNKQRGCVIVITTQSGKPFTGSKYAGLAVGTPVVKYPKYYKTTVLDEGPVSLKLSKLSSAGGSGVAKLKLKNGDTYDTANVTLTSRLAEP